MNRLSIVVLFFVLATAQSAYATNTVEFNLVGFKDLIDVSAVEFSFLDNDEFGLPVDLDERVFPSRNDFVIEPGPGLPFPSAWEFFSLITDLEENLVAASGFGALSTSTSDAARAGAPDDGLFVRLTSQDTCFAIDTATIQLFDFENNDIEILSVESEFTDNTQIVTVTSSAIPLMGSGIMFFIGSVLISLRRRFLA
jgi:hypothetical protein